MRLAFFALISSIALGSAVPRLDLAEADRLAKNQNYFEAMKIYARCLSAKTSKELSQLEDCLYQGEQQINRLTQILYKNSPRSTDLALLEPYRKLGIDLNWGYMNGIEYGHTFFKKLKTLFSDSKYKEEVDYVLIEQNISGTTGWQDYEKSLNQYLTKYPNSKYVSKTKFRLAVVYDNLWDLMRPSANEYHKHFSTGNDDDDEKNALAYRDKALSLYSEILKTPLSPELTKDDIIDAKERAVSLKAKRGGYKFVILND